MIHLSSLLASTVARVSSLNVMEYIRNVISSIKTLLKAFRQQLGELDDMSHSQVNFIIHTPGQLQTKHMYEYISGNMALCLR